MENENRQENTIDLRVIGYVLWRRLFWIVAFGLIGALLVGLFTTFFISPVYSSTAKFYVNNSTDSSNESSKVSSADITASQSLAETAIVITKNDSELLQQIADDSGTNHSANTLSGMISAGTYSGTEAFYIKISSTSASDAYALAKSFQKLLPDEISKVMIGGEITSFDSPKLATSQDSPSVVKNALVGAFVGIVLSFLVFFLQEIFDNTIYSEEDLKNINNKYPVIGLIPTISVDIPDAPKKKKKSPAKAENAKDEMKGE